MEDREGELLYALDRAEALAVRQAQRAGELKAERDALKREVEDLRRDLIEAERQRESATYLLKLQMEED